MRKSASSSQHAPHAVSSKGRSDFSELLGRPEAEGEGVLLPKFTIIPPLTPHAPPSLRVTGP